MRSLTLLLVVVPLTFAGPARAAGETLHPMLPPAKIVRLENGLTVLLAPDPGARLVSMTLGFRVGSADDPNGRRGLAHLVEHLTMLHTAHVQSPARFLESLGAVQFNASTSPDTTAYFESVPPERLANALWLAREEMGFFLPPTASELKAECRVVRNEDIDRMKDQASAIWTSPQHAMFPHWHPYSRVGDGDADLDAITGDDVRAFRAAWYTPRNATLAIAGRFDSDGVVALVKRAFEALPSAPPPVRPTLPEWTDTATRTEVAAPWPTPVVAVEFRTPSFGEADDAALDLAATILAGPGNTRLKTLVDRGLVSTVSARQRSQARASVFGISANLAPGAASRDVEDVILRTVADVSRTLTDTEVERARALWQGRTQDALETSYGRAGRLSSLARIGRYPSPEGGAFDWDIPRYEGLTRDSVQKAIVRWLDPAHRVVVYVTPDRAAPLEGAVRAFDEVAP